MKEWDLTGIGSWPKLIYERGENWELGSNDIGRVRIWWKVGICQSWSVKELEFPGIGNWPVVTFGDKKWQELSSSDR